MRSTRTTQRLPSRRPDILTETVQFLILQPLIKRSSELRLERLTIIVELVCELQSVFDGHSIFFMVTDRIVDDEILGAARGSRPAHEVQEANATVDRLIVQVRRAYLQIAHILTIVASDGSHETCKIAEVEAVDVHFEGVQPVEERQSLCTDLAADFAQRRL